ncbi:MAG TPA: TetR family transcriptional regulator [Spirochaetota bacterium]|nr:TetR family transcriptional regulator [Spirochaetota bacterium]
MKQDKRAKRTRAWLLETLLELIEEKEYSEISITELTEKADIARQTFYRNYDSMDDILLYKMDEILDEYFKKVQKNLETKNDPYFDFEVKQLVYEWQRNEALFKALQKSGLAFQVLEKLSAFFSQFHMKAQNLTQLDEKQQFLVYYLAGGVYMVLNKWFEHEMHTPMDILVDIFKKSAMNIDKIALEYIGDNGSNLLAGTENTQG